jgi:hypothetical protein
MKKVTLTAVLIAIATASVFAQATVSFNGGTVHVYGTTSNTFASLLGAPGANAPESNLLPAITPPMTFRTGPAGGTLPSFIATFNNIPPDAPFGSFELVAWDNSSGLYPTWNEASVAWVSHLILAGRSPEVTLALGGFPPPVLFPTPVSFTIGPYIPEPRAAVLMGLGAAAFLYAGKRETTKGTKHTKKGII